MARTKKQQKGDTAQAHGMPFLKLALGSGLVLVFFVAMGAGAQNLLKGNITKQNEIKQNADLVNRYGEAASDPAVADALRKAQGQTTAELKEKSSAYEALQNGTFKPGADPTMAIMHGYVPPNMSPAQAQILSRVLPKMPRMPHPPTPEDIERMAGEPQNEPTAIEPDSPYIPYPESFAKAHGLPTSRKLQPIPQQMFNDRMAGMPSLPNATGMPMMGFGAGIGNGMGYGLSKAEIAAQNQRIAEECIRARFGPVDMPKLQPGHAAIAAQARKNADTKHISESDHQSVVGVCDASGNEITSIQYDPWGNPTVLAGGSVMPDFMYKGMYYHSRSGKYLTLYRAYDPKLGRWLSRDPLSATPSYDYCGNDPINRRDPLGLDPYLDIYKSRQEAGLDAFKQEGLNQKTADTGNEQGFFIYQDPDSHLYGYTPPFGGSSSLISAAEWLRHKQSDLDKKGITQCEWGHTHPHQRPAGDKGIGYESFSPTDIRRIDAGAPGMLGNAYDQIRELNPHESVDRILSGPSSPGPTTVPIPGHLRGF